MANPRSIVNQGLYLQKEVIPGIAVTNAMRRYGGIRLRPGWNVETEEFSAEGYKTATSTQVVSESGQHTVETIQDFNSLLPILASVLTYDGVTQPDAANAPNAYEHTFSLRADAADDLTTFTAIWGDDVQALRMVYLLFNSITFGIQRGALTLSTSAISKEPETGVSIPATGVTEIKAVPLPSRGFNVWIDDEWADLGTTQAEAVYEGNLTVGDKRAPTSPINRSITSFESLLENEGVDFSGSIRLGFESEALAMQNAFRNGTPKFIRYDNLGPLIAGTTHYELAVDVSARIKNPGEIGSAPNSTVVSLPFDYLVMPDDVSGNTLAVRLVNTVPTL